LRRVEHLKSMGLVQRIVALLNPASLNLGMQVVIGMVVTGEFNHFVTVGTQDMKAENEKRACKKSCRPFSDFGGVDGTRTRDPRRDRPVF
jgi:hypothetical protein